MNLIHRIQNKIRRDYIVPYQIRNKPKIFGVGNNKTGTTSLKKAMEDMGYVVGHQGTAEKMMKQWSKRDFKKLIEYCHTAQFFQDLPFSKPYAFNVLDYVFPRSKFILTIRDSPEQWYNSLTKFHAKKWGKNNRIPTKEDLQKASYIYKGAPWDINRWEYTTPENDPYNKEALIKSYVLHNENVIEYFRHRPNDLLVLNVADKDAYAKLCEFLGEPQESNDFPWENRTAKI